jgi:hypothetical protein
MFALPRPPEEHMELAGGRYRLVRVFKHDFWAATCLYDLEAAEAAAAEEEEEEEEEANAGKMPAGRKGKMPSPRAGETPSPRMGGTPMPRTAPRDWPPKKIVVKIGRAQPFCGFQLAWVGAWLRDNEYQAYRLLAGVQGVPRWVGSFGATGYAVEYIDGRALDQGGTPPPGFFDRLRELFDAVHARGLAYVDSNKRSNILVGADGRPYLVDYQISVRRRDDLPWPLRAIAARIVRYLSAKDIYHLYKHKRRLAPAELTPEEDALSRERGGLHGFHRWFTKGYRGVRRGFLREQYEKGALQSPTADREDYHLPEKDSWRK